LEDEFMTKPIVQIDSTSKDLLLTTGLVPDALRGGAEEIEAVDSDESARNGCRLQDAPFCEIALLDQLRRRPYHSVTLEGPFYSKLWEDHRKQAFRSEKHINRSGQAKVSCLLLCLGNGVFAFGEDNHFTIYAPNPESADAAAAEFRRYVKPQAESQPHFYIVCLEGYGPVAEAVPIDRPAPVTDEDLTLHYGADFLAWEKQWLDKMRRSASGLTILLGPQGCGKTTLIRAQTARLYNKAVFFFVPVDSMELLTSPRFVSFWVNQTKRLGNKRKIAIIEDAEELLLPREGGTRDKVSSLLNIADGFLGDYLKLHVLATTNVPIHRLDPAIIRPGRLTGSREFRRLTRSEAKRIAEAKGFKLVQDQEDYSLAEIYCGAADLPTPSNGRVLGFGQ
jgi:hypothetical protein